MKRDLLFISLVALIVLVTCNAIRLGSGSTIRKIALLRGGAKKSSNKSSGKSSSKKKPAKVEEEDDEDESNEDDEEERPARSKASKKSKNSKTKPSAGYKKNKKVTKFQLIPWGNSKSNDKKKTSLSMRERLEQIAKAGQSITKDVYRRAKVLKSSAFEGMLLKATWPGNDPVPTDLLVEIIKYSIPAFKYSRADADDDPYYMTLHKLWMKMVEIDWRTITKSAYILHCIVRDSSAEACEHFAASLKSMSKTKNPKKPDHKYFDLRVISTVDANGQPFQAFVKAYAAYVLFRAKTFTGRFEELQAINEESSEKKVLTLLKKAQQAVSLILSVEVSKKQSNVITGQAIKLLAVDIRELWKTYTQKIAPFLEENKGYAESKATSAEEIKKLLEFYQDTEPKVQAFLTSASKTFQKLQIRIPVDLQSLSAKDIKERLLKISGGAKAIEEDEEDDEDEDDEEEDEKDQDDDDDDEEEEEEEGEKDEKDETTDNDEDEDEKDDESDDDEKEEEQEEDDEEEEEGEDDNDEAVEEDDEEEEEEVDSKKASKKVQEEDHKVEEEDNEEEDNENDEDSDDIDEDDDE